MMIHLSPVFRGPRLDLSVKGDVLTINGDDLDLSFLAEGDVLPRTAVACDLLASDVTRTGGEIVLTLFMGHGPDAAEQTRYPAPVHVTVDGKVTLPPDDGAAA